MRFGGYIRVSRVGGRTGDAFLSPTLQRERIHAWADQHGHVIADVREDLDVSGTATDRRQLVELVELVEQGRLDGVVVATLDRFSRSIAFGITLIERIHRAGGQFVSVADGFDTRTPYGELALNIMLSIAQLRVKEITAQWRTIVERQIADGRHPGGTPPFGYERGEDRRLRPDENGALVIEVFRRVAAGESLSSICRDFNARGIVTQRGSQVTRRFLHGIVANRAYLGEARSGDLVRAGAHEALVDEETWVVANSGFRARPAAQGPRAVLAGLVRCQGCRYCMAPVKRDGRQRYRCLGVQQGRKCPAPAFVTEAELLPVVEAGFFAEVGDIQSSAAGDTAEAERLRGVLEERERELVAYRDEPGIIAALGAAEYADGLRVRQAAVDVAVGEFEHALRARARDLPDVALLRGFWQEATGEERSGFLRDVFDAIVIRKHPSRSVRLPIEERVLLVRRGELGPSDVPSGNGPLPPFHWPGDPGGPGVALS